MEKCAQQLLLPHPLNSQRQQANNRNSVVTDTCLSDRTTQNQSQDNSSQERASKKMRTYLSSNQSPGHQEERGNKRKARSEDYEEDVKRKKTSESSSQQYIIISSGSEESKTRTASCVAHQVISECCILISSSHPSPAASSANTCNRVEGHGENFEAKYRQEQSLGSGGFGAVFAGYRRKDLKPVAIKHVDQKIVDRVPVAVNGQVYFFPLEAMLMCMAADQSQSRGSIATIALLDYFDLADEVILVMERPEPCVDLRCYIASFGHLHENRAKNIQKQLVDAAIHMLSRQVFHRDLKPSNILVILNSDGPHVKVIDFGCGAILTDVYSDTAGTTLYNPPEMNRNDRSYTAEPATVWQLAAVLYTMLHGCRPFKCEEEIMHKEPTICNKLSQNCCEFLVSCLAKNSVDRPTLKDLQKHPWMTTAQEQQQIHYHKDVTALEIS